MEISYFPLYLSILLGEIYFMLKICFFLSQTKIVSSKLISSSSH